jgi:hypothetical protein
VQTSVVKKSQSPQWNAPFCLPVTEPQGLGAGFVQVSVFDWDVTAHELIGAVRISLPPLATSRRVERHWYELGGESGEADRKQRGRVELAVRWRHNRELDPVYQASLPRWEWEGSDKSKKERRAIILRRCESDFKFTDRSRELNLRRASLTLEQAYLIGALLQLDRLALLKLDLRDTQLSAEQVRAVASGLAHTKQLEVLNFSRNNMADERLDLGIRVGLECAPCCSGLSPSSWLPAPLPPLLRLLLRRRP